MAAPITVYDQNHKGHIITVPCTFTSGGATTAVEITLTAGLPYFDLSKAHPIICGWLIEEEGDAISGSNPFYPADEIARSSLNAPDTEGEFQITGANKFKYCNGAGDADGTLFVTYWAAGNAHVG